MLSLFTVAFCLCSPYVIGALYEKSGSHFNGMYVMGAGLAMAALIVASYMPRWSEAKAMPHAPSSAQLGGKSVDGGKQYTSKDVKSVDQV